MKQIMSFGSIACAMLCGMVFSVHASTPHQAREKALNLTLSAAVDSDCDGDISDETAEDASFTNEKMLRAGECLIYRTDYRNDGDFAIRKVELRMPVPKFMIFLEGTASHIETPPGLWPTTMRRPTGERKGGEVVWSFRGGLHPGESGRVEFGVMLAPLDNTLDFVRKAAKE